MTKRAKLLAKLRAMTKGSANLNDVVTLLEAYDFRRDRVDGSHWMFIYTDENGKRIRAGFPIVNGKTVRVRYVKDIVDAVDEARAGSED